MPIHKYYIGTHIVVNDPDPIGWIAPDTVYTPTDMEAMMRLGRFTPGTLLRRKSNGALYRVSGAVGCKQELVAVCEAAKVSENVAKN